MRHVAIISVLLTLFFFLHKPLPTQAKIGVGVGTGKITIDEALKPGMIYQLPSVTVLNTGDEDGIYKLYITYHESQSQQRPPRDWFVFSPEEFKLTPGTGQATKITLTVPVKAKPGQYFAYIEAQPQQVSQQG
jgi:P pilus assembly chaperone PapD